MPKKVTDTKLIASMPKQVTVLTTLGDYASAFDCDFRKSAASLLADLHKDQDRIIGHLGNAVLIAESAGRKLIALKSIVKHGLYQEVVTELFCKPHHLSIRTAERYVAIARNFDLIEDQLRNESPSLLNATREELFRGLSMAEVIRLIRKLLGLQAQIPDSQNKSRVEPDRNDWITPDTVLERVLNVLIAITVDPCSVPNVNSLSAATTFSKPMDALSSDCRWSGRMFINPGIHKIQHGRFLDRALLELSNGNVEEAILCLPVVTNSSTSAKLRSYPRVFITTALEVTGPAYSEPFKIRTPLMLAYVGPQKRFSDFGNAFTDDPMFAPFIPFS